MSVFPAGFRFRFSLRSLMLVVLCVASVGTVGWHWKSWQFVGGMEFAGGIGGSADVATYGVYSPDGQRLALLYMDQSVRIWDEGSGKLITRLAGGLNSVGFSPDGKHIISACEDGAARVWDAESGRELATLVGHAGSVSGALFSPDGKRIFTAGADSTVRVWDAANARQIAQLEGHSTLR